MLDPRAIHIYTDGSAYRNPGHVSGCAVIVRYPEHLNREDEIIVDFGCPKSTNQRMELMACLEALKWLRRNRPWEGVTRVLLITDSLYAKENINRAATWKKRGWRNRYGEPKANDDLWDDVLKARSKAGIRVDFIWQEGKTTEIAKRVDKAAKAAAKRGGIDLDSGYRPGGVSRSMVKGGPALRFPANGQVSVIRPYGKKIMFRRETRIAFNVFEEATQTYSGKFFVFAEKRLAAELHMGNGHRVQFNSDPNYPQVVTRIEAVSLPKPTGRKSTAP